MVCNQFYWLWAPINFENFATHFDVNEYASGKRWHETGFIIPDGDQPAHEMTQVEYSSKWRSGTRWAQEFSIDLIDEAASRIRMEMDSKPEVMDSQDRRLIQLKMEVEALKKESDSASVKRREELEAVITTELKKVFLKLIILI